MAEPSSNRAPQTDDTGEPKGPPPDPNSPPDPIPPPDPPVPSIDVTALPAVLAGPMIRRLTRTQVSVWVALSRGDDVTLTVRREEPPDGAPIVEVSATTKPLRIGRHLWVTLLTVNGVDNGQFESGVEYRYDLNTSAGSILQGVDVALQEKDLPTFLGLPSTLEDFRFVHTSCRQPNLDKRDSLAHTLELIEDDDRRPHLLIMSGDQVYQDSVSSIAMIRILQIAEAIVNMDESNPFEELSNPLYLNSRGEPTKETYGLSGGGNHLWTFAEYCANYLLYWSDVFWPQEWLKSHTDYSPPRFRDFRDVCHDPEAVEKSWDGHLENIQLFIQTMPEVRKALANIPTLTMHDDHEVTDDWNLNYDWMSKVYDTSEDRGAGRRIIANGLLSYLLFQHWGNVPAAFETSGSPEQKITETLRTSLTAWESGATETSPIDNKMLEELAIPLTVPPSPPEDYELRDLENDDGARYDYRLGPDDGYPCHLVFLDEHTARQLPTADAPCARVSPKSLDVMWPRPEDDEADIPTVLVAPVPVVSQYFIEQQMRALYSIGPEGEEEGDIEDWTLWSPAYQHILARISEWKRVIILSGDVHFGSTQTLTYRRPHTSRTVTRAAQFVASGTKRADLKHMMLHLLGDFGTKVGLFRTREFYVYETLTPEQHEALMGMPAEGSSLIYDDMIDVLLGRILRKALETPTVLNAAVARAYELGPPDWSYTTECIDEEADESDLPQLVQEIVTSPGARWEGWAPDKSVAMIQALRASDLHRIGRAMTALPQIAYMTFPQVTPLRVRQETLQTPGETGDEDILPMITEVNLG